MPSFSIPLTGLEADSTALNTISNNLSNMNTTAFKNQTSQFANLFYQQVGTAGSGDPISVGAGSQIAATQTDFSQGSISATGQSTDVAINGAGFFVVDDGGSDVYTRAGNFTLSSSGNLTTQSGQNVMGYPATNGVVNTNSQLTPINIPTGQVEQPKATANFSLTANLDSAAPVGTSYPAQVTLYDSLGTAQSTSVTFTKTGNNTWNYSVSMPETLNAQSTTAAGTTTNTYNFGTYTDATGGHFATVNPNTNLTITGNDAAGNSHTIVAPAIAAGEPVTTYATDLQTALTAAGITTATAAVGATNGQLVISGTSFTTSGSVSQDPLPLDAKGNVIAGQQSQKGTLSFDGNGNLITPGANVAAVSFGGLSDGATPLNMTWDLYGGNGKATISQVDQNSAVSSTSQDGYPSGQYQSFSVGSDGTVSASFSNGQKLVVGQLALANVTNEQGLQILAGGNYGTTKASGAATIGIAGAGGLGTMQDGALEGSNVNISAEFSNLIVAQRAFEANSKAVTTFDQVTEYSIQMLH